MDKEPMTLAGYNKVTNELDYLKSIERPQTVVALDEARQLGDLKENAEYHSAKEKLKLIDVQIAELSNIISKAVIVDPSVLPHDRVSFGSTVTLFDVVSDEEFTYTIVGGVESNVEKGFISFNSPLAKQLMGKVEGDEFTAKLPGGDKTFEVYAIFYKEIEL
ncbi:transcription elongation factor GreA [Aliarcobacter skirrowii]|jgi:transcription elongation factor GreA|uniref:Transcription elongation factor GreA n=2 Tax=Aliarcobacter skirrowii TaxID=28200 RepID=A0AAD0SRT2_9BACT|nr:transcription elongation factor GreA [Aliarcobacter skirrowii]AXX85185.1 transcription elongation factor GreA [Aliarcobacter skirrowii CCUG 10374]AZL54227.1 transcription elongation factor GreA [Aliarcobacter skirrowii]KAB0620660.1 transcription elongation factor GreA [Aliarcobacter skirrowii CCUG 10374]MCT7446960.1 transcription elongation factor GreA [Aliarcobacter skirrowii]MDD2508570.1 transcription elongation factor GreA [Aliarcobacter skirrowii]